MRMFSDVVDDQHGNIQPGIPITVKLNGVAATIYSDSGGLNPVNPVTTDPTGIITFYYNQSGIYTFWNGATQIGSRDLQDLSPTTGATLVGSADGASGSLWTTVAGFIAKIISSAGSSVIGFIQAGTGAVARTVQGKERDCVSVKDFGAAGDGVTDDTTAILAAITYINGLGGGSVAFPSGTYLCASQLTLGAIQGVRLVGGSSNNQLGACSTIKYTGTATPFMSTSGSAAALALEHLNVTYSSGSFTGTLIAAPVNQLRISNCTLSGVSVYTSLYLLDINNSVDVSLDHVSFGKSQYAISGQKSDGTGFANVVSISQCQFAGQTVSAIRNPGQGWEIDACDFENLQNNKGSAIVMDAACQSHGLSVSGSWFSDATTAASAYTWILWQGSGLSVTGCYFNGTGGNLPDAIALLGTSYGISISGNYFSHFANAINLGSFLSNGTSILGNHYFGCTNEVVGSPVSDHLTQKSGTWTPSPTNLSVVGSASYVGYYQKLGSWVTFSIVISTSGGGTTASTAGVTTFSLPLPAASGSGNYGACAVVSPTTGLSLGAGFVGSALAYPCSWAATSNVIVIQGTYQTSTL